MDNNKVLAALRSHLTQDIKVSGQDVQQCFDVECTVQSQDVLHMINAITKGTEYEDPSSNAHQWADLPDIPEYENQMCSVYAYTTDGASGGWASEASSEYVISALEYDPKAISDVIDVALRAAHALTYTRDGIRFIIRMDNGEMLDVRTPDSASVYYQEVERLYGDTAASSRLEVKTEDDRLTGERCGVCLEPQFNTDHGVCCSNGHGGADAYIEPRGE